MRARSRNDPAAYIMARTCMGLSVSSGIHRELLCLLPVNREGEVSDLAGQPTIRAEPPLRRSRRTLVFGGPTREPNHEGANRFGGEAPRRCAHSNERSKDHVLARVALTLILQHGFEKNARNLSMIHLH